MIYSKRDYHWFERYDGKWWLYFDKHFIKEFDSLNELNMFLYSEEICTPRELNKIYR